MFKALMDYTLNASYSWHTPGHGGGTAFRKSPVGQLFYQFFGENTLRSDISVSVGQLGSLLDHTGPIAAGERNAARIFGADETLFVVGGTTSKQDRLAGGPVSRGDLVLCDRNCHKSILHSVMTVRRRLPDPVAQRARHYWPDRARSAHAGSHSQQDRRESDGGANQRQSPSVGDDELHL
jgi:arginine/lysine/ornithine decarboxylase